jgi:hypothetical protein
LDNSRRRHERRRFLNARLKSERVAAYWPKYRVGFQMNAKTIGERFDFSFRSALTK